MADTRSPAPVLHPHEDKARKHFERYPAKTIFSMLGAVGITTYIYVFFWRLPLYVASVEGVVYSWGGVLAALIICVVFKLPRILTQRSGDEWIPITEVFSLLMPFAMLMFTAGRASTEATTFPELGQFAFWVILSALVLGIGANIYQSIRLAVRTYEGN